MADIDWDRINEVRKIRSQKRSQERKELLKTPPKHHMMFLNVSNKDLIVLLKTLFFFNLNAKLIEEIEEQHERRGGAEIRNEHFNKMTRDDLLRIIYTIIAPEINRIDNTPLEDLGLLLNETWSCPQLTERIKWRLENAQ
jgi:hypothetical protein